MAPPKSWTKTGTVQSIVNGSGESFVCAYCPCGPAQVFCNCQDVCYSSLSIITATWDYGTSLPFGQGTSISCSNILLDCAGASGTAQVRWVGSLGSMVFSGTTLYGEVWVTRRCDTGNWNWNVRYQTTPIASLGGTSGADQFLGAVVGGGNYSLTTLPGTASGFSGTYFANIVVSSSIQIPQPSGTFSAALSNNKSCKCGDGSCVATSDGSDNNDGDACDSGQDDLCPP